MSSFLTRAQSWTPSTDSLKNFSSSFSNSFRGTPSGQYGQFEDVEDKTFTKIKVDIDNFGMADKPIPDGRVVTMEVPDDAENILKVKIPEGYCEGRELTVQCEDGRLLKAKVPPGHGAGDMIFVPVPKKKPAGKNISPVSINQVTSWVNKNLRLST